MYRKLGHHLMLSSTLSNVGEANLDLGRYEAAITSFGECLEVVAGMDATDTERDGWRAYILPMLGDALLASGDEDAARAAWTQDLAVLARISGHPGTQQMFDTRTEAEVRERLSALVISAMPESANYCSFRDPEAVLDILPRLAVTWTVVMATTARVSAARVGRQFLGVVQAAWGAISTMRSALRAVEMRSSRGMVGTVPPGSRRERAGWVMPARAASSTWDSPSSRRRSRTVWPISKGPSCFGEPLAVFLAVAAWLGEFLV